jgi:hypothetical protein
MTRIRYKRDRQNNTIVNIKPLLCGSKFVNVNIDLKAMEWTIYDAETKQILSTGVNNTLTKIKKDIKLATIKLGATYYNDVKGRRLIIK